MNGLQFLTWLRNESGMKLVPVVVLTTSVFASDVRAAYLLGANSFLTKPADFAALTSAISQMCAFWLGPCRLPGPGPAPGLT
jgi:CheY-like chemotaxis protein